MGGGNSGAALKAWTWGSGATHRAYMKMALVSCGRQKVEGYADGVRGLPHNCAKLFSLPAPPET